MKFGGEIQYTLTNSFSIYVRNRITKRGVGGAEVEVITRNEVGATFRDRGVTNYDGFVNISVPGSLFHTYGYTVRLLTVPSQYIIVPPSEYHIQITGWGQTKEVYFSVDSEGGDNVPPGEGAKYGDLLGIVSVDIGKWFQDNLIWIIVAIVVIIIIVIIFKKMRGG